MYADISRRCMRRRNLTHHLIFVLYTCTLHVKTKRPMEKEANMKTEEEDNRAKVKEKRERNTENNAERNIVQKNSLRSRFDNIERCSVLRRICGCCTVSHSEGESMWLRYLLHRRQETIQEQVSDTYQKKDKDIDRYQCRLCDGYGRGG